MNNIKINTQKTTQIKPHAHSRHKHSLIKDIMPNNSPPTQNSSLSHWLEYMAGIHVSAIDLGLERVRVVFDKLAITPPPVVFSVAGTNGKGSTTATIAQLCQSAGYKTALYQSPHLVSFNERIHLNNRQATDDELIGAFVAIEQVRQDCQISLSFFEMTTLAAFVVFSRHDCDVWVLEIGLGGRLDVVNLIDPSVCVITNIAIDHTDWLGDDREAIGFEKAGILRPHCPLIYGECAMPESIKEAIIHQQARCYQYGIDYSYTDGDDSNGDDSNHSTWIYSAAACTLKLPRPKLALINASAAISAVLASGLTIDYPQLCQGLADVQLMGRFDCRRINNRQWVFDVAHNPAGVQFLMSQLMPFWQQYQADKPHARLHLLFSMLADKDIGAVLETINAQSLPIASWHIAALDNPRAASVAMLSDTLSAYVPADKQRCYDSIAKACNGIIQSSQADDVLLCLGSFHTIAESLITLEQCHDFKAIPN